MESWLVDMVGYCAGFLTTVGMMPQALKVMRTNDTRSLSLGMYVLTTTGIATWLIYGVLRNDSALILANGVVIILALFILIRIIQNEGFFVR